MRCDDVVVRLSAHLDGEVPDDERRMIDAHLDGCEHCRRQRAGLAALSAAVARLPREAVSGSFDAAWERRLAAARRQRRRRSWRTAAWASGMAAALVLIMLGLVARRDSTPRRQPPAAIQAGLAGSVEYGNARDCGLASKRSCCRVVTPCADRDSCGPPAPGSF